MGIFHAAHGWEHPESCGLVPPLQSTKGAGFLCGRDFPSISPINEWQTFSRPPLSFQISPWSHPERPQKWHLFVLPLNFYRAVPLLLPAPLRMCWFQSLSRVCAAGNIPAGTAAGLHQEFKSLWAIREAIWPGKESYLCCLSAQHSCSYLLTYIIGVKNWFLAVCTYKLNQICHNSAKYW